MGRHPTIHADDLLDAAERVVMAKGPSGLTLGAVSQEAGVSKGGLQYLFTSKEALLRALVQRMSDRMEAQVEAATDVRRAGPGRQAAGYVRGHLSPEVAPQPEHAALLAAVANDLSLLAPEALRWRQKLEQFQDDGLSFERAAITLLATDGLWLLDLLGIASLSAAERQKVADALCADVDSSES
ncbi:TetR/AcrR family transcriptional regulator [Parvularcula oceani]|uniref:TetR/AcrR family transcriptional regulator n=1 Tax=Parvularcula oceani TaxID=1247963 RepID=UPI00068BD336|nr:TetR/AcrR family transcriptional regulator [Parvularcula oceani]